MTIVTYNEIDDYYEVMTRFTEQRYSTRQQAAIAANEAGDTVYLVNFDPAGMSWMRETLNILAQFRTDRAAIPARPRRKRTTQAQQRYQEGAR